MARVLAERLFRERIAAILRARAREGLRRYWAVFEHLYEKWDQEPATRCYEL